MIFLDTHVVVWLYARLFEKISSTAERLINEHDLVISPIVRLELKYLNEIGRLREGPSEILGHLESEFGIQARTIDLIRLIEHTLDLKWTRDPFDRIIVGQAMAENTLLLSRDESIRNNVSLARW